MPDTGSLDKYNRPCGPGIRIDDGFEEGMDIPIHYDPMLSKLIVHHDNRENAIDRMLRAIEEYEINGLETTLSFGKWVMHHEAFRKGDYDTNFIEKYFKPEFLKNSFSKEEKTILSSFAAYIIDSSEQLLLLTETVNQNGRTD